MALDHPLVLGTRGSALALAQTRLAVTALRGAWPGREFDVREIRTTGDLRPDLSLTRLAPGGHGYDASATVDGSAAVTSPPAVGRVDPGLFTRELETELLAGRIDVAVHSLKDLPTALPDGLTLAAVLARADPADVLIWKLAADTGESAPAKPGPSRLLPELPTGAWVASSSLRRERQLLQARPDLRVCEIRGNVGTRLRKLAERAEWSGTILALAGLERLGYRINQFDGILETVDGLRFGATVLPEEMMLPAVGQGAIGLQARSDDAATLAALAAVNDLPTWLAIRAERELLRLLGGGCQLPLGVGTEIDEAAGELHLRAVLYPMEPVGQPRFARLKGDCNDPETVAAACARDLSTAEHG